MNSMFSCVLRLAMNVWEYMYREESLKNQKRHKYESSLKNSLHDQGSSAHTEKAVVSQGHKLLSASSDAEKLFCEGSALFPSLRNEP